MSRTRVFMICLAVALMLQGCARWQAPPATEGALELASNGKTAFKIVMADDASPSTQYGARELQRFIKEMTGAELPIVSDKEAMGEHEIILGDNAHLAKVDASIDSGKLGDEGYVVRTVGPHIVIAGGDLRGNMYGVYGLLEDHLGCRWFAPDVSRIPKLDRLMLPAIDDTQVPVLESREPFTVDCFDGDWCARNRMNGSAASLEERHGGKVRFGAGMFVHTFNRLVPPETYFDEHPEYFSEIDGKRIKDHTQLCCTNEDVVRICIEETKKQIRNDPGAFVYSVSQNDWQNYCECATCQALAEAEGTQMAPVLQLVNRVAEAIEQEFPDKAIETLAYQYTRKAPKTMRPRQNVIIRLCSIECCFMHPLATCDSKENREFAADAREWAKVADRLWVWDYVTSFSHYLCPFPNLRVRDDNIRFFIENNVRGIFEQDVYNTYNGELSPLSGYINAKFLWNPNYDEDQAINEFLDGVYGKAAKPIRKYIDMLHNEAAKEDRHTNIWIGPTEAKYLNDKLLAKADRLWEQAERAVADDPDTLFRVRTARMSVDYAMLERDRGDQLGKCRIDHENFRIEPNPTAPMSARALRFFDTAHKANVTRINESSKSMEQYEAEFEALIVKEPVILTPIEAVAAKTKPGMAYGLYEGSWEKLPDFTTLKPAETGIVNTIGLAPDGRAENYALRYTGYFEAKRNGIYYFHLASNDGSRLTLGKNGEFVIDNDGLHAYATRTGMVALKKGFHPITAEYFQTGGGQALLVHYEGPGTGKKEAGKSELSHGID